VLDYVNRRDRLAMKKPFLSSAGGASFHTSSVPNTTWHIDKQESRVVIRAAEGTLGCWYRLHLQSSASTPVSRRVGVRQAAGRKINSDSLSQNYVNMLYRPHFVV
jgi:hypothetical protein